MPIYEYQCANCGHQLEKLQKMSDDPLTTCPECGQDSLTKLVSAAGFRLKGGGWYETDFKKDGKKNLHETGDKPKESSADTDQGKPADKPKDKPAEKTAADSKPAAKPPKDNKPKAAAAG